MSQSFEGQVAIVTGGSRGIGLAIARLFAERGATVIAWGRDFSELEASRDPFRPARMEKVDVADQAAVESAFQDAVSRFGKVDILVNNAGINGPVAPMQDYSLAAWDQVIATDLTGVFYCCRAAIDNMVGNAYGRIVNISSIVGKEGVPNICAYSAAKAGVIGLTKGLARELAATGVTVNCVAPAMTETNLIKGMSRDRIDGILARIPMGRLATVDDVAETTAWVASPACSFTTGFVFDVTGGRADY